MAAPGVSAGLEAAAIPPIRCRNGAVMFSAGMPISTWIIDVVAPFGGADVALKSVRERALAGRKVKALQPAPDGSGVAVVEW